MKSYSGREGKDPSILKIGMKLQAHYILKHKGSPDIHGIPNYRYAKPPLMLFLFICSLFSDVFQ
jgi:hypothetical protein